ncbi:MAG: ABC-type multidrug transport system, ATPase and permease component [Herbinix sp.]|jgi:ATP-binding cassette subfamily B protein|nr:ABC-type multidrug transport system, ATPase and permease component [Herbinix sp.]
MEERKNENPFLESYEKNDNKPIRILLGLYKGYYSKLFWSAIFYVIKVMPVWIIPIITSNIINIATTPSEHDLKELYINVVVMIFLLAENIPMHYLHTKYYSRAIRLVESGLRGTLVRKLQQLSISYHKEMESGRIQSKIMRDVEAIEMLSGQLFVGVLSIVLNLAVAFTVTAMKSWTVFLFFILSIPVSVALIVAFRKKIGSSNANFRKEMETTSARVFEMVELIPVTRAHGLQKEEVKKMEGQLNSVAEKGYRLDMVHSIYGASNWAVFQFFKLLCLAFTGYLAYQQKISIGEIILYQTYFASIITEVSNLITLLPTLARGIESVRSVGEIVLAHDVEDYRNKTKIKHVNGTFLFEQVRFEYKDSFRPILKGLNLEVKQGETIAFVGESGAGKSTILNLIIGFLKPTGGKIYLDGIDLSTLDMNSFRKHLAVVPQNVILFSGTIRQNITYGLPHVEEKKLEEVIKAANLGDLVNELPEGLDTMIGEHGGKLSGGQRQRISIARALMRDPSVIILDEATSALDSASERMVQEAIQNLSMGRTTFIVAHRLSTIRNADRIAVIGDGICKEIGSYEELIHKKGEFYRLEQIQ